MLNTSTAQPDIQKHPHTPRSLRTLTFSSQLAQRERDGAGEGIRAGDVDERGAGGGVPGGGGRRVRDGRHRLQGHGAQEPGAPRQKPVRANPCISRRGSASLRVPRDLQVRAPQVQDRGGGPAEGRRPGGSRHGGRVDGGGRADLQPGDLAHRLRVPHQPDDARDPDQRQGRGREPREAHQGAGGLRGAPGQEQVPGRGLLQLRRPQPLPLHLLLHGHAPRRALRLLPARQGLVGDHHGQARRAEDGRQNGSEQGLMVV